MSYNQLVAKILTAVFCSLMSLSVHAQLIHSFIVMDGRQVKKEGMVKQHEKAPYQSIKITNSEGSYYYKPNQVEAYTDYDGNYYESREIDFEGTPTKFFLKHVSDSEFGSLWFCIDDAYVKRFFLDNGQLTEMKDSEKGRDSYKNVMRNFGDCKNKKEIFAYANFSEKGLGRTLEALSSCVLRFTPSKKLLFTADIGTITLNPMRAEGESFVIPRQFLRNDLQNKKTTHLRVNIGLSLPYKNSNFSIEQYLGFSILNQRFNNTDGFSAYTLEYENSRLDYTLLLKKSTAKDNSQFSFMVGPVLSFTLGNDIILTETGFLDNLMGFVTTTQELENIQVYLGYETRLQYETKLTDRIGVGVFGSLGHLFPLSSANRFNVFRLSAGLSGYYNLDKSQKKR